LLGCFKIRLYRGYIIDKRRKFFFIISILIIIDKKHHSLNPHPTFINIIWIDKDYRLACSFDKLSEWNFKIDSYHCSFYFLMVKINLLLVKALSKWQRYMARKGTSWNTSDGLTMFNSDSVSFLNNLIMYFTLTLFIYNVYQNFSKMHLICTSLLRPIQKILGCLWKNFINRFL
jgi:hypothetical protein